MSQPWQSSTRISFRKAQAEARGEAERLIARQFLNRPLVETGGGAQLSEQYFDTINSLRHKRGAAPVASPYDIALCGGEPYGRWM